MDDLYGNAWSSSDEPAPGEDTPNVKSLSSKPESTGELEASWRPTEAEGKTALARSESDGWHVGEDVSWNGASAKSSLWSGDKGSTAAIPDSDVWGPAAGFQAPTDKTPPPEPPEYDAQSDDDEHTDTVQDELEAPQVPLSPAAINLPEYEASPQLSAPIPKIDIPDVGVHENIGSTTVDSIDDEFQWGAPSPAFENSRDDVWESAWSSTDTRSKAEASPKDEWEVAKEKSLRRDRAVPPEVMASIMEHLNGISEVWPSKESNGNDSEVFGNWRDGLSSVEGLSELVKSALPEVALQPLPPYLKTNTAKAVNNSLRLSRNLPIVRHSPLSHLFATKASSAWELSVRNKVEVQQDDVPAGWRMVDPEAAKETKPTLTEKKSSGILSFWSRRTASSSTTSLSEAKTTQPPERTGSPASNRSSIPSAPVNSNEVKRTSQSGRATPEPSAGVSNVAFPLDAISLAVQSTPAGATASLSATSVAEPPAASPAPTAVSRFWNRFSRTKSDVRSSSTSPRSSIALSTNELDFLSEIVPSAHDGDDEEDLLGSLSSAKVQPKDADVPPPPALSPPPLAPPPRPSTVTSNPGMSLANPKSAPTAPSAMDDLSSLFGSAPTSNITTSFSSPINPVSLPPLLPPPILPLSKPPTPSPLAGVRQNHSRSSSKSDNSPVTSSPLRASSPANFSRSGVSSVSPMATSSMRVPSPSVQTLPMTGQSSGALRSSSPAKPLPMPPPTASFNTFDDDEFSAFHSPSQPTPDPSSSHVLEKSFSSFSDASFLSHPDESSQDADDSFGDFSAFISPPPKSAAPPLPPPPLPPPAPARSPSPPKPPRKNSRATLHIRKPSEAEQRAVVHLVEKAATRVGRWPAPPSPIPELLPKPPSGSQRQQQTDFFSLSPGLPPASPGLLMPIAQPNGTPPAETTPPASVFGAMQASLISPPPLSSRPPSAFELSRPPSVTQKSPVALPSSRPSPGAVGKSGLSAQDLSFFEGL